MDGEPVTRPSRAVTSGSEGGHEPIMTMSQAGHKLVAAHSVHFGCHVIRTMSALGVQITSCY